MRRIATAGAAVALLVSMGCAADQTAETTDSTGTTVPATTSTTAKPRLEAEDEALAARLPQVPGYSYVDWTESALKAARLDVQHGTDAKQFVEAVDHVSNHTVVYDDHLVATLNAYSVRDPASVEDGGAGLLELVDDESSFVHESSRWKDTTTETIGEHEVLIHTFDDGWTVWSWYDDGVVYQVQASDADLDGHIGRDYVEGAIAVQEGNPPVDPGPIPPDRYQVLEDDSPIIHERLVALPAYYYTDPSADISPAIPPGPGIVRLSQHGIVDADAQLVATLTLYELEPEIAAQATVEEAAAGFDQAATESGMTSLTSENRTIAGTTVHVVTGFDEYGTFNIGMLFVVNGVAYELWLFTDDVEQLTTAREAIPTALIEGASG